MNINRFQAFFNGPAQNGSMFNIHRFMAGEQHLEEGDKNYRQEIIQTEEPEIER